MDSAQTSYDWDTGAALSQTWSNHQLQPLPSPDLPSWLFNDVTNAHRDCSSLKSPSTSNSEDALRGYPSFCFSGGTDDEDSSEAYDDGVYQSPDSKPERREQDVSTYYYPTIALPTAQPAAADQTSRHPSAASSAPVYGWTSIKTATADVGMADAFPLSTADLPAKRHSRPHGKEDPITTPKANTSNARRSGARLRTATMKRSASSGKISSSSGSAKDGGSSSSGSRSSTKNNKNNNSHPTTAKDGPTIKDEAATPTTTTPPAFQHPDRRHERAAHNQVEKNYRSRLNDQFDQLLSALAAAGVGPASATGRAMSKGAVLDLARRRLAVLEREKAVLAGEVERLSGVLVRAGRVWPLGPEAAAAIAAAEAVLPGAAAAATTASDMAEADVSGADAGDALGWAVAPGMTPLRVPGPG